MGGPRRHLTPGEGAAVRVSVRQSAHLVSAWGRYLRRGASPYFGRQHAEGPLSAPHVIHLTRRTDRRERFEQEFRGLGLTPQVFEAMENADGARGCALSHRGLLTRARSDAPLWVCEDDIAFDVGREQLEKTVHDFLRNDRLDVLCLAHKTRGPTLRVSPYLAITVGSFTTASYIVKPRAREALRQSFDQSAMMLALGVPRTQAAIDVHWQHLQRRELVFCVPLRMTAHQASSFSDTEGRDVDYYGKRIE